MNQKNRNVLFFADHPWQTQMCLDIIARLQGLKGNITYTLIVCDFFSVVHVADFLPKLRQKYDVEIIDFLDLYLDWQVKSIKHDHDNPVNANEWKKLFRSQRSQIEIEKTNQLIYGFERNFYFLPISECCKNQVFADVSNRIIKIFTRLNPNFCVSIERQTLPLNISQAYCESNSIPWFSITPTRINNRWVLFDEFALGMSERKFLEIKSHTIEPETKVYVKKFISNIEKRKVGSYITWHRNTFTQSEFYAKNSEENFEKLRIVYSWIITFIKQLYSRFIIHPRKMRIKPLILETNLVRLTIFEIRSLIRRILHLFGFTLIFKKRLPSSVFVFWGLHVRPEGSSNVLSLGQDEIQELERFAKTLPNHINLVVKENPIMFGQRKINFYRYLRNIPNVYLLDPDFSSVEAILKSSGVAGISGTTLLEGVMLGKPSICFGYPEFIKFLSHAGWSDVKSFIDDVTNQIKLDTSDVEQYLGYLIQHSSKNDVEELGNLESENGVEMIDRFSRELLLKFQFMD